MALRIVAKELRLQSQRASQLKRMSSTVVEIHQGNFCEEITTDELSLRRSAFMDRIAAKSSEDVKHHLVVIPAASVLHSTYDVPYPFRQNSEFLYLTGSEEPDGILVLHTNQSSTRYRSVLFIKKADAHKILWEGPSPDHRETLCDTGVDQSLDLDELKSYLQSAISQMGGGNHLKLWLDHERIPLSEDTSPNCFRHRLTDFLRSNPDLTKFTTPLNELHQTRWRKSASEQNLMRRAGQIGADALAATMKFSIKRLKERKSQGLPGVEEYSLLAKMDYESRLLGAKKGLSYPPVIAGGNRANTIHYLKPYQTIKETEMVLMDAGCEYRNYVSDITRTWPVSGCFTPEHLLLYEIVLDVQETVIKCLTNDPSLTLSDLYHIMALRLGQDLVESGILPNRYKSEEELMRVAGEFCPHHVGHYLGIDVHDTDRVRKDVPLESGVAITVEPGLYFRLDDPRIPEKYRGVGIRIEDDVLITETGVEVLTKRVPKTIADILKLSEKF